MDQQLSLRKRLLYEFLFWLHAAILVLIAISGFLVSLPWLIVLSALWKLHIYIFHGCAITQLQIKLGLQAADKNFVQVFVKRLTGRNISRQAARHTLAGIFIFAFISAIVTDLLHYKLF